MSYSTKVPYCTVCPKIYTSIYVKYTPTGNRPDSQGERERMTSPTPDIFASINRQRIIFLGWGYQVHVGEYTIQEESLHKLNLA